MKKVNVISVAGEAPRPSITDVAADTPLFSTLVSVLQATGLDKALDCDWWWCTRYTVFAPTDDAFSALAELEPDLFKALTTPDTGYGEHLKQLLLYHVVKGRVRSKDIKTGSSSVESQQGEPLEVEVTKGQGIQVQKASVIEPFDVKANNGIIHTIDGVLIPSFLTHDIPTVASKNLDLFSTLVDLLDQEGLVGALEADGGPFTVFAPTNEAFEKLLANINLEDVNVADILKYHVIQGIVPKSEVKDGNVPTLLEGEDISVSVEKSRKSCDIVLNGGAKVIAADVLARNGVIHVIDEVLIPPSIASAARSETLPSIVDVVSTNPDFSILLDAVKKAGLVEALSSTDPMTVFAPTNEAFKEALVALEINGLDDIPLETLEDILLYHVLSGAVFSKDLPDSALVEALNEKGIAIDARKGVQLNGNTHVIDADIETSNGVIHVIDKVLLPPKNLVAVLTADGRFTTLVSVVGLVPNLAETLLSAEQVTIFAPTDEAFEKVPQDTLEFLQKAENVDDLANLLLYHVVGEFVPVQALEKSLSTLLEPETISVHIRRFRYWWWSWRTYLTVTLNGNVHVEDADLLTANGVIHAIDGVLSPP
jgi:transforming growth factor-beta-induced protein